MQLAGPRLEQADVDLVPLHVDAASDPPGRRRVVGRGDLNATVQMHTAAVVLVVAEGLERQRAERGAFFGEYGGDLPLARSVDAGVGPVPSARPLALLFPARVGMNQRGARRRLGARCVPARAGMNC